MNETMTIKQAALHLNIETAYVRRLLKEGVLKRAGTEVARGNVSRVLITIESIEKYASHIRNGAHVYKAKMTVEQLRVVQDAFPNIEFIDESVRSRDRREAAKAKKAAETAEAA